MHLKTYERRRVAKGLNDKPALEAVFVLKQKARRQNKAIQTLFLTLQEFQALQDEVKDLGNDMKIKIGNDRNNISKLLGIPIEVLTDLESELVDKIA